eukprot:gnl/TRDRNA2_/TRDRNA2_192419_c0_seq1.p1 gnl/TRDRNA2_/TRDRNA2_192419_c0~~gnl/TRDRNA2_/TRDRNA2_192419_c0_seq1.p1  ORF type:complete len:162 (+),score=16.25 gnl/TRDRNA2_/TRDRNA2_192419_c0_seq1:65-550(+)
MMKRASLLGVLAAAWLRPSVAQCLTFRRTENGTLQFGELGQDFCAFLEACLGVACPIPEVRYYLGLEDQLVEELPNSVAVTCGRIADGPCRPSYEAADKACAGDAHSRSIWWGEQRGICVKCQAWTAVYRKLRDEICPGLLGLRDTAPDLSRYSRSMTADL